MLKLIFWLLLLANAALFAAERGYLGALYSDGREPARVSQQLQTDTIKLLVVDAVSVPAPVAPEATNANASPPAAAAGNDSAALQVADAAPVACTEIGNFNAADARHFSSQLAELAPKIKLTHRDVQDIASHMVYLPSLRNKEGSVAIAMAGRAEAH